MNKGNLIELTNKLYKLTLLFPKKEPLRYRIREIADEVLANFVSWEALRNFNPGSFVADWEKRYKDSIFLLERNLEILKNYFEIAKWQNWVSFFDVLEIQEKYDKMQSSFKQEMEDFKEEARTLAAPDYDPSTTLFPSSLPKDADKQIPIENSPLKEKIESTNKEDKSLDSRKEKILEFLKEKNKAQVQEIKEIFPDVSKRTIRRDFVQLLEQGLVEKIGERNSTFYKLAD